jgi:hypothetical protein
MVARWDLDRLLGYLGTWSAVVRHRDRCGSDPLDQIRSELEAAWDDPGLKRDVTWPLNLRVGRVVPGKLGSPGFRTSARPEGAETRDTWAQSIPPPGPA